MNTRAGNRAPTRGTSLERRAVVDPTSLNVDEARHFMTAANNYRITEDARRQVDQNPVHQSNVAHTTAAFLQRNATLTQRPRPTRPSFHQIQVNPTHDVQFIEVKRTSLPTLHRKPPKPSTIDEAKTADRRRMFGSSNFELTHGADIFDDVNGSAGKSVEVSNVLATNDNLSAVTITAYPSTEEFVVFYGPEFDNSSRKPPGKQVIRNGTLTISGLPGKPHIFVIGTQSTSGKIDTKKRFQVHSATPLSLQQEVQRDPTEAYAYVTRRF